MTSRKPRPAPNRNGRGFASSCTSLPSAPTPAVTRRTHRGRHAPPRSTARVGCRSSGARKGSRFRPLPQGTGGRKRALLGVSPRRTPLCSSGNRHLVSREMGGGWQHLPHGASRLEETPCVRPGRGAVRHEPGSRGRLPRSSGRRPNGVKAAAFILGVPLLLSSPWVNPGSPRWPRPPAGSSCLSAWCEGADPVRDRPARPVSAQRACRGAGRTSRF